MQQPFGRPKAAQTTQHGPDATPTQHGPQAATMEHGPHAATTQHAPHAATIQHGPHMLVWRGPRVRSDPAVGSCDDEDDGPPACGRGPARNTLGLPGLDSPTGQRTLGKIWHRLKDTQLQCRPNLEISAAIASARVTFMWVIIWWRPLPVAGMLRPYTYHCTVARASAVDRVFGDLRTELDIIQNTLRHMLMALLGPLPFTLALCSPPWRSSWNFGIDTTSQDIATAIRIASSIMLMRLPGVHIAEHRPIHISWT